MCVTGCCDCAQIVHQTPLFVHMYFCMCLQHQLVLLTHGQALASFHLRWPIIGAHGAGCISPSSPLVGKLYERRKYCWQWCGPWWKRREDSLSHRVPRIPPPCDDQLLSLVELISGGMFAKTLSSQKPRRACAPAAPTRRIPRRGGWVRFLCKISFLILFRSID